MQLAYDDFPVKPPVVTAIEYEELKALTEDASHVHFALLLFRLFLKGFSLGFSGCFDFGSAHLSLAVSFLKLVLQM